MQYRAGLLKAAALACAVAALAGGGIVQAATLHVAPVRIVLTPTRPVAALTLGNGEDAEVAVQAQVFAWSQENGEDIYVPTQEVLVNPSIFRIAPGGQQIIRLGLQVPAERTERSYRIFLQQLPRDQALPQDAGGGARLQTLLRIGVPVFVPPTAPRQALQWRIAPGTQTGGGHVLQAENGGSQHIQLTQVAVRREGGAELARKGLSQYLLAGQTATLPLPLPTLAPDTALQIESTSDAPSPLPAASVRVPRADTATR